MRSSRERGSIALLVMLYVAVGALVMVSVLALGKLTETKLDMRHAADTAALVGAWELESRGLYSSVMSAQPAVVQPMATIQTFNWTATAAAARSYGWDATAGRVSVALVDQFVPATSWLPHVRVQAQATAAVKQETAVRVVRPKLVMALDFSGSMRQKIAPTDPTSAIAALRAAATQFLAAGLELDLGAVFFDTNVWAQQPIGYLPTVSPAISAAMARHEGGDTDTADALTAAQALLGGSGGRYILLVSDGAPCCTASAVADALGSAAAARAAGDVIYALEIPTVALNPAARTTFLRTASAGHYFSAVNAAALTNAFAATITCAMHLAGRPTDASMMFAYLRDSGTGLETPLARYGSLTCPNPGCTGAGCPIQCQSTFRGFSYDAALQQVDVSQQVCREVNGGSKSLVVRYDRPFMAM